jgi:membrane protease YdiL (CAAX protease family)
MKHLIKISFDWQSSDIQIILPLMNTLLGFITFWFISKSEKIKTWFSKKNEPDIASIRHITFNRIMGFFAMGVLPSILCFVFMPAYTFRDYGLAINMETTLYSLGWTFALSILAIPLTYNSARKPTSLINYPQIRAKIWNRNTVIINAATWVIYLAGYEFLFRGILLFPLVHAMGAWPAIAINIAMYSATHIPKGLEETIGAILLGLVLCILTLLSGTIWIALFVHIIVAWTNCFTALKFHPDIKFLNNK